MTKVARLISAKGHIKSGKQLKTSVTGIEQGLLLKLDSTGSSVSLANAGTRCEGIAFGLRYRVYAPTTQTFNNGEPLAVVWGNGEILLSVDFFSSGALPTLPADVYVASGTTGKWATSGSASDRIGHVRELVNWTNPVGGTGVTQVLAHVQFSIGA